MTISSLIEEAVQRTTRRTVATRPQEGFKLVTFGRGGRFSSYDVNKTSALLELEDVERFGASDR